MYVSMLVYYWKPKPTKNPRKVIFLHLFYFLKHISYSNFFANKFAAKAKFSAKTVSVYFMNDQINFVVWNLDKGKTGKKVIWPFNEGR